MKLENSWKSKIGVADVNQALEMLRWPQLTSFSTLNTPSSPKLMIFPSTIKSVSIGYILPGKTVSKDISQIYPKNPDISIDIFSNNWVWNPIIDGYIQGIYPKNRIYPWIYQNLKDISMDVSGYIRKIRYIRRIYPKTAK